MKKKKRHLHSSRSWHLTCLTKALVFFKPKRVAITGGYHGFHATIEVYKKACGADMPIIGIDDEFEAGDLCWLETPLNPTGESR